MPCLGKSPPQGCVLPPAQPLIKDDTLSPLLVLRESRQWSFSLEGSVSTEEGFLNMQIWIPFLENNSAVWVGLQHLYIESSEIHPSKKCLLSVLMDGSLSPS